MLFRSQRTIAVKNQCTILCDQLVKLNYLEDPSDAVINGELVKMPQVLPGEGMS